MQLIVITPENHVAGETKIVNEMFAQGLKRLHLRKHSFGVSEHQQYLDNIDKQYRTRIVIHDYFELYDRLGLGGIHLNSFKRNDAGTLRQLTGISPEKISTSFHSWQEVLENSFQFGYAFVSPVFNSISKQDYFAQIVLEDCLTTKHAVYCAHKYCPQIIGLGGVGSAQIEILNHYGFDGAALLGAIWQSETPTKEFEKINKKIKTAGDR